jgi:RNA polymerase sigma factor (sigma-70 family)
MVHNIVKSFLKSKEELFHLQDDIVGDCYLKLVETLQPDVVDWDEKLEKSENFKKIGGFVRITIMRHLIDSQRRESRRSKHYEDSPDVENQAFWSDGWSELEALEGLTAEERVVLDLFFRETPVKKIASQICQTQKQTRSILADIANRAEFSRPGNTPPLAKT